MARDVIDSYYSRAIIYEAPEPKILRWAFTSNCFINVTDYSESRWTILSGILKHGDMNRKRLFATLEYKVVIVLRESHEDFFKAISDRIARYFVDYDQTILELDFCNSAMSRNLAFRFLSLSFL